MRSDEPGSGRDLGPTGPKALTHEWVGSSPHTVVLFGGSPVRRDEVVRAIGSALDVNVVGALSESDGLALLDEIGDAVDLVLIGGAYDDAARERIRRHVGESLPGRSISEPGRAYPYSNERIVADVSRSLALRR